MKNAFVMATATIMFAGCANIPEATRMQPTALNYNKVVSGLKNELILLNIARASKRQPMHFTRITSITNSTTLSGKISLGATIPEQGSSFLKTSDGQGLLQSSAETVGSTADTITPGIEGSVSLNPVFGYEVLDSKEFYNGILAPLTADRFLLYQSQGWPTEFLAMLMIEKITFSCGSKHKEGDCANPIIYENNPDKYGPDKQVKEHVGDTQYRFRQFVETVTFGPGSKKPKEGKDFSISSSPIGWEEISNLAEILAKPEWSPKDSTTVTYQTGGGAGILVDYEQVSKLKKLEVTLNNLRKATAVANANPNAAPFSGDPVYKEFAQTNSNEVDIESKGLEIKITFRSITGVMYFLGECVRAKDDPCYYKNKDGKKSFVSRIQSGKPAPGSKLKAKVLSTFLNGKEYWVPDSDNLTGETDRTFSSISFINQLLNLQQNEKETPTTATIIGLK